MSLKIAFRFDRTNYSSTARQEQNAQIKQKILGIFDQKGIEYCNIYTPARNSIKVIFPSETEVNKVVNNIDIFQTDNFEPRLGLKLKANRTVFCTNLDPTIIGTYDKQDIKESLTEQNWKIKDVYIMKSKKSLKIDF